MKKVFIFLLMGMFMLSFASAELATWDNWKNYDEDTREVTIRDLTGEIGKAKLLSPLNVNVGAGYQEVARFDLWAYENYNDAIKQFTFTDMKKKEKINRDIDMKILSYEIVEVNDYGMECNEVWSDINQTNQEECLSIVIGSHEEEREVWDKVTASDLKKNEKVTIGLFTEVKVGDYVDWIPTIYGVEVDEWATWTSNLNVDIVSYYRMEEDTGYLIDATPNGFDCLDNSTPNRIAGKIDFGQDFTAAGELYQCPDIMDTNVFSFNFWVNPDTITNNYGVFAKNVAGASGFRSFMQTDGTLRVQFQSPAECDVDLPLAIVQYKWKMVSVVRYANGTTLGYVNGTKVVSTNCVPAYTTNDAPVVIAANSGGTNGINGKMDELAMWDRVLTGAEITALYNDSIGLSYVATADTAPNITLNSPASANYTTSPQSLVINFTAYDDVNLSSVKLYVNDVLNQTNSSGINDTDYLFDLDLPDGDYTIYGRATDNKSQETNSSEINIFIDSILPVIAITHPTGVLGSFEVGDNETLNYTITDTNLDSCWYSYNSINITLNCSETSDSFLYVNGYDNITIYANDTLGNENSATSSWSYTIIEINQTYPVTSVESANEVYTASINYNSTKYTIITALLNINGTTYSGTKSGSGDIATMTSTATMPTIAVATNFTSYWTFSLTDATTTTEYNLSSNNVSVGIINLTLCDATNNVPFWNFTILNESNGVEINSSFSGTFNVKPTGTSAENIFSYLDSSGTNSTFDFCISPGGESYTIDTAIKLSKVGYVNKFYDYQDIAVTNATREDNLYMLASDDSTSFIVHAVYVDSSDVIGASIEVQRFYEGLGTWVTTEIITTNYVGEAVGHLLSEDADYRFLVKLDGVSLYNSTSTKITCSVAPCTVTLTIPITVASGTETIENLVSTLVYSDISNTFTYSYADSSGDFTAARLYVVNAFPSNASLLVACDETKLAASGVITCDITGQPNGTYVADAYITRDAGEFLDKRLTISMGTAIYNAFGEDGVLWAIFIFIGIVMIAITRPSLAIVFGTFGLVTLSMLSIIKIGTVSIVAVSAIAIILLMRIGRE